jgi:hypothetical protein
LRVAGRNVAALREFVPVPDGPPQFGPVVALAGGDGVRHPVVAATRDGAFAVWARSDETAHVEGRVVALR